jgi:hypothetical protein
MALLRKVFEALLSGRSNGNIRFGDLQRILRRAGFSERCKGSHFIYFRDGVLEIINIQEGPGGKAKPYQVKQVRGIITTYGLSIVDED